jgi:hypothetical protein
MSREISFFESKEADYLFSPVKYLDKIDGHNTTSFLMQKVKMVRD